MAGGRRATVVAAVVLFVSFVDVFALLPTVAPHVTSLGAGPALVGLTVGAYSAGNLPANVLGGVLVDRWGRRPVVVLGLALAAAAVAAYPLPGAPGAFVLVRVLHGLAGGVLLPAVFALAGDRARAGATGRLMGRLGAVIGAAAVLAPAGAGVLREATSTDAVFLVVAGILLAGSLLAWLAVAPTPARAADGSQAGAARAHPEGRAMARGMRGLLAQPRLRRALLATALTTAGVGVVAGFLPEAAENLGAAPSAVGGLFTLYALAAGAVMLSPVAGRVDRDRADGVLAAGLGILGLGLATFALAGHLAVLALAAVTFGLGFGLLFPAASGVASLAGGEVGRGRAFGLFNAAFSLGLATGAPVVGALADRAPGIDPFAPAAGLSLVAAVALTALAGLDRADRCP